MRKEELQNAKRGISECEKRNLGMRKKELQNAKRGTSECEKRNFAGQAAKVWYKKTNVGLR